MAKPTPARAGTPTFDLGQTHLDLAVTALTAPTPQDAWPSLVDLILRYGADTHIIMHFNVPYTEVQLYGKPDRTFIHRYPLEILQRITSEPEYARSDPIARRVLDSKSSFFVDTAHPESIACNDREAQYIRDLRESGLRCGSVITLHNREERSITGLCQGVGFGGEGDAELVKRSMDKMRILATYFNEGLRLRGRLDEFGRSPLSDRERNCLSWAAVGRTTEEIAEILAISPHTANEYIKNAARKLGASNRTQACTRAFLLSLIDR